jgi:hypothetical protein
MGHETYFTLAKKPFRFCSPRLSAFAFTATYFSLDNGNAGSRWSFAQRLTFG